MRLITGFLIMLFFTQGCSIYKAANAPGPIAIERAHVGSHRTDVVSVFGKPQFTEVNEGQRTEMFEFTSGYHEGSKARILLYIAGDFFTLGLTELVFWPAEMAMLNGTEGRAVATYGTDDIVRTLQVTKKDGGPW